MGSPSAEAHTWNNLITLTRTESPSSMEQALCHEILELMVENTGLRYLMQAMYDDEKGELREQICQSLENALWRFLTDNTNFFKDGLAKLCK